MIFPQYLWRVGNRNGWQFLRRGNSPDEPIEKWIASLADRTWTAASHTSTFRDGILPMGVLPYCGIGDKALYGSNHAWDWLNQEGP